jgi:hypothetical protein
MTQIYLGSIPTGRDVVRAEVEPFALAAMARQTLRQEDRVAAAVARLQGFFNILHDRLCEERREAMRRGENSRVDNIERQIDNIVREFGEVAQFFGEVR